MVIEMVIESSNAPQSMPTFITEHRGGSGAFKFQRAIPKVLQPAYGGRRVITKYLRGMTRSAAMAEGRILYAEYETQFRRLKALSPADLAVVAANGGLGGIRDEEGRRGGKGLAAMMHDLVFLEQPRWIDLRQPPRTPWRADQVEETFELIDAWWHEVMRDGEITGDGVVSEWPEVGQHMDVTDAGANQRGYPVKDLAPGHLRVPADRAWASLQHFAKTNPKRKGRISKVALGKFLADRGVSKSRPGDRMRTRCYDFPPLAELHAAFTKVTGIIVAGESESSVSDFSKLVPADIDVEELAAWAAYGRGEEPLPAFGARWSAEVSPRAQPQPPRARTPLPERFRQARAQSAKPSA
jgi:hypothetical protein